MRGEEEVEDIGQWDVEMQDRMEKLTQTLALRAAAYHEQSGLSHGLDKLLPWRTHIDWPALFEHWIALWNDPDEFENAGHVERWKEGPMELVMFELGVIFGIDYEQAYPEGRNDEWPIPVAERGEPNEPESE